MTQEEIFSLLILRYLRGELLTVETSEFETFLHKNPEFQAEIEHQRQLMTTLTARMRPLVA